MSVCRFKKLIYLKLLFISTILFAQINVNPLYTYQEICNDIDSLVSTAQKVHPTIYNKDFVQEINHLKKEITSPISTVALFRKLQPLVAVDGHTLIQFKGNVEPALEKPLLPFETVVYDEELFVKTNLSIIPGIKPGYKILSINNVKTKKIINHLMNYIPGETKRYKFTKLSGSGFSFWYQMVYGNDSTYTIQLQHGLKNMTYIVKGIKRERFKKGKSKYFSCRVIDKNIAYLKITRFRKPRMFLSFIDSCFSAFQEKNIKHLIISVKGGGGFGDLADSLMSYITDKPYRQWEKQNVKISKETESYILENQDNGFYQGDFFIINKPLKIPTNRTNRFKGNVYVLTGPKTYSTMTLFAAMAKCYSNMTLIGEEAGQPLISNGGISRHQLPNTGMNYYLSLSTYTMSCAIDSEDSVQPDFEVIPTLEDLIYDREPALVYTLKMIREN